MGAEQMITMTALKPFDPWVWQVPEYFNIGVACSDVHLGTPAENRLAMIVEDDERGTSEFLDAQLQPMAVVDVDGGAVSELDLRAR